MEKPQYYKLTTGAQRLVIGKRTFDFIRCDQVAGKWWAVYKAEKEEEIKILNGLAGSHGVKAISEDDYYKLLKKKKPFRTYRDVLGTGQERASKPLETPPIAEAAAGESEATPTRTIDELSATEELVSTRWATSYRDIAEKTGLKPYQVQKLAKNPDFPAKENDRYDMEKIRILIK